MTTRLGISFNNKTLNGDVSAYDGHQGTGPSMPVHAGVFLSGGRLVGTGEIVELNAILNGFVQPGSRLTTSADLTLFKRDLLGSHEFQTGMYLQPYMRTSSTNLYANGGFAQQEVVLRDPNNPAAGYMPFHNRVYDAATTLNSAFAAHDNALYVQDAWKPAAPLTINLGLRLDFVKVTDTQANVVTENSLSVGPRFGVAYVLTKDQRNVLRASWGRIHELVQSGNIPNLGSNTLGFTDSYDNNLDGVFETVLRTPGTTTQSTNRVIDPDAHRPYIDEWTAGYRRQLPGQISIDGGFVHREYRDRPAMVEINGVYDGNIFKGYQDVRFNEKYFVTNDSYNWF